MPVYRTNQMGVMTIPQRSGHHQAEVVGVELERRFGKTR